MIGIVVLWDRAVATRQAKFEIGFRERSMNLCYRLESRFRRYVPRSLLTGCWQILYVWGEMPDVQPDETTVVGLAEGGDWDLVLRIESPDIVRRRRSLGGRCWIAKRGMEAAGILWTQNDVYHDLDTGVEFLLGSQRAWWYGGWVRPDLRSRGIFRQLVGHSRRALNQAMGVSGGFVAVDRSNRISQQVQTRLGAKPIGWIRGGAVLGFGRYTASIGGNLQRFDPRKKMSIDLTGIKG